MAKSNKKSAGSVFDLVCNLIIAAAAVLLLVALFLTGSTDNVPLFNTLVAVGCGVCAVVSLIVLISAVIVLFSKINHRSPEYKIAVTRTVIMAIILIVAVIGFIWAMTLIF